MNKTNELLSVDVSGYVEKKNNLSYLSWSNAWREFIKIHPQATYIVVRNVENGLPLYGNAEFGYMVYTRVTVDELTHEMWLPVMDHRNKSILKPTTFDINKAVMRCLTKNLAMFGLGLSVYAGEDLPEQVEPLITKEQRVELAEASGKNKKLFDDVVKNCGYADSSNILAKDYKKVLTAMKETKNNLDILEEEKIRAIESEENK